MRELQKSFRGKSDQKNKKNKIKVKRPHMNKNQLARKRKIWFKQNTRPIMN